MATGDTRVHEKDRALFERIDATLAAYDESRDEATPSYLQPYADELDRWHQLHPGVGRLTRRAS